MSRRFAGAGQFAIALLLFAVVFIPLLWADPPEALQKRSQSVLEQLKSMSDRIRVQDATYGAISIAELAKFMRTQIIRLEAEIIYLEKKVYEERRYYNRLKQDSWRSFLDRSVRDLGNPKDVKRQMNTYLELKEKRGKEEEAKSALTEHKRQLEDAYQALKECRSELRSLKPALELLEQKVKQPKP